MSRDVTDQKSSDSSGGQPSRLDEVARQTDEQPESDKSEQADKQGAMPKQQGAEPDQGLGGQMSAGVSAVRNRIASIVWLIAVLCAVILAIGTLLAALSDNINESNPIVEFINETAAALDGPFGNIITFDGRDDRTKEVLVNWGLAAVAYLVVGRILDRLIRA